MRTLIISDIHQRIKQIDSILNNETFDRVVFLGDYFDDFNDTPQDSYRMALWLKKNLQDERFVFLFGNHDISYFSVNRNAQCSGYTDNKDIAIWEILDTNDFDKFKFFWMQDGWLCSHAGLVDSFLPPVWKSEDLTHENIKKYLLEQSELCLKSLHETRETHWFFQAGDARRWRPIGCKGGILWCDFNQEFEPIKGLAQIFGHTPQNPYPVAVRGEIPLDVIKSEKILTSKFHQKDDWNIALDCHSRYYGVIQDGELEIKRNPYYNENKNK